MELNCVLFIPVSSPSGIGEYMRSMIIAKALELRWPNVKIHFILNEQVAYLKDCPYTVHACKDSPTKELSRVNDIIGSISPDLVVFDASGRAKQFKKAKVMGAKVAFISQHNKKRSRGLKLNRLLNTDIHWVVQPDYCIKSLSYWQQTKLAIFNKKAPENIGPVFELSNHDYQVQLLKQYDLSKDNYFIFNAGSGGHKVTGALATDIYYQAAKEFYQKIRGRKIKMKCVVLFGSNYPKELPKNNDLICLKNIENKDFITLLSNAKGCVISAGDTLLQCIALHKACVAASVSPDQPVRLKLCQNKQLVFAAEPNTDSLVEQALLMLDEEECNNIIDNMKNQAPVKGLEIIVDDIVVLFSDSRENNAQQHRNQDEN
jgi:ADP-heptose:LPS heptosyltransferase